MRSKVAYFGVFTALALIFSYVETVSYTHLASIDHEVFELAVDTILNAGRIYVIGIRSCAPPVSYTHLGRTGSPGF